MVDAYTAIRQFGADVSSAITAGPRARLQGAMWQRDFEDSEAEKLRNRKKDDREDAQESARLEAAELYRRGKGDTDEFAEALIKSGDIGGLAALRKVNKPPKPRKPDKYLTQFNFAKNYAKQANADMGKMAEDIATKQAAGEEDFGAMEAYTEKYDATKKVMEDWIGDFEYDRERAYATQLTEELGKMISELDPDELNVFTETMVSEVGKMSKKMSVVMNDLENATQYGRLNINASGIPAPSDIAAMAYGVRVQGGSFATEDEITKLMKMKTSKEFREIIEEEGSNPVVDKFAGALFKVYMAKEAIDRMRSRDDKRRADQRRPFAKL